MDETALTVPDAPFACGAYALDARRWTRRRMPAPSQAAPDPLGLETLQRLAAAHPLRHIVVGIIGPREANAAQRDAARRIGRALGETGVTLICGGRSGVMNAASEGCAEAGGLMIGILPGSTPEEANPYVGIPLPTGLGEARNMVIAKSARVLIAIGGSYGTLSEVAYGLHFSKPVIGLEGAPAVDGVRQASCVDSALDLAAAALFASAPIEDDAADTHDHV